MRWTLPKRAPSPTMTEFITVADAVEYANTHRRPRSWRRSYEEVNTQAKLVFRAQAVLSVCLRTVITILDLFNQISVPIRRVFNRTFFGGSNISGAPIPN